jgi:hypothetical protein
MLRNTQVKIGLIFMTLLNLKFLKVVNEQNGFCGKEREIQFS